MILLDSLFINNGGGKILLDYLVEALERSNLKVYYLFDARCKGSYSEIEDHRKCFLEPSLLLRFKFYVYNKGKFTKIFCLGNIPPPIYLNAIVYTYFHQALFLESQKDLSIVDFVKVRLKLWVIGFYKKHTSFWLVQTDLMRQKLKTKLDISENFINVLPFFPKFYSETVTTFREKNTYLYVSNASKHKNHLRLIDVFCKYFEKYREGKLILTIDENYPVILDLISEKQKLGVPIVNIGFVGRNEIQRIYYSSEFLIYPSLSESFGLGLIEGIHCGCKVIAANLAYTFEVCIPSLSFDPLDDDSLFRAFENSRNQLLESSYPVIDDKINELLNSLN
jgi:glycosyltransferase involved in cell wall biosynthesis